MKNKIVIIVAVLGFIVFLVLASSLMNDYTTKLYFESDENSGNQNSIVANQEEEILKKEEKEMENMKVFELTSENYEEMVVNNEKTVLIDFYADWCAPCKMMSPVVEKIAEEQENIIVFKVNVDNEPELAIKYGVMSIPTFVVVKNGEEANRAVGAIAKSELEELIK